MTWLDKCLEVMAGAFVKDKLAEMGATPGDPSFTLSVGLPSGYSVDAERAEAVAKLETLCHELISDPALMSRDITNDGIPETFCNRAVIRAAQRYGCYALDGLSANAITAILPITSGWQLTSQDRATQHAQRGGLAVAAKSYVGHGHVAVIAPRPMELSGSWRHTVPMVANVGRPPNRIKKTSEAFTGDEPEYFIYGEVA